MIPPQSTRSVKSSGVSPSKIIEDRHYLGRYRKTDLAEAKWYVRLSDCRQRNHSHLTTFIILTDNEKSRKAFDNEEKIDS